MSKNSKKNRADESAIKRAKLNAKIDTYENVNPLPAGAIPASHDELAHNNTYGQLPMFYLDQLVVCRECGTEEVWKAENQKWWYEEKKANINSEAIHCRQCREIKRQIKTKARQVHLNGINKNT